MARIYYLIFSALLRSKREIYHATASDINIRLSHRGPVNLPHVIEGPPLPKNQTAAAHAHYTLTYHDTPRLI